MKITRVKKNTDYVTTNTNFNNDDSNNDDYNYVVDMKPELTY